MEQKQITSRLGMFTASSIYVLNEDGKNGNIFSVSGMTYIYEKIAEIITGERKPQANSASLTWGIENEKDAYLTLNKIIPHTYHGAENFKFFEYNTYSGGSPDGLNDTHVFEYKCPYVSANHIQWLLACKHQDIDWLKKEHKDYYGQLQFNMMSAKRDKAIIMSYDPRVVEHEHRAAYMEVPKDAAYCAKMDDRISKAADIIKEALKVIS